MSDKFGLFRVGSVFCYKPVGSGRVGLLKLRFGSDSVSFTVGSEWWKQPDPMQNFSCNSAIIVCDKTRKCGVNGAGVIRKKHAKNISMQPPDTVYYP